jgi:hypothetical protein
MAVTRGTGEFVSYIAGADLSAKQYRFVKQGTDRNEVVLATAATDKIIGVLQNDPVENEGANVRLLNGGGSTKLVAGGSITKGAYLTTDANGAAVATTTAGQVICGQAHEDADAGDIFEALLDRFHHKA